MSVGAARTFAFERDLRRFTTRTYLIRVRTTTGTMIYQYREKPRLVGCLCLLLGNLRRCSIPGGGFSRDPCQYSVRRACSASTTLVAAESHRLVELCQRACRSSVLQCADAPIVVV